MSDEVFQKVATEMQDINNAVSTAKSLIAALREVGEDVSQREADLNNLEKRKVKWEKMLKRRGY